MSGDAAAAQIAMVLDEVERAVVGKRDVLESMVVALIAGGHVLIEDVPGVAKTLMARSLAAATDLSFGRVQFTPDLVPSDITGSALPAPGTNELVFQPGPLFANLVLGDEVNRAPPKTQAALLEAMEEAQVTVDGVTHYLPQPFMVIATQNPIESDGTYPLPHAQLDRFMFRLSVGPLAEVDEVAVLRQRMDRGQEQVDLDVVLSADAVRLARETAEQVAVDDDLLVYTTALAAATRSDHNVDVGVSTRAAVSLVRAARARAVVRGRDYVVPDDVKALARVAFAHRLVMSTEAWVRGVTGEQIIEACLQSVPVPASLTADDRVALRRD
ncbi:MAG: MoxR family ATPase [Actinomycetota bacterium]|nr:MoxR family ATPase [Actinomycetota bacterium]